MSDYQSSKTENIYFINSSRFFHSEQWIDFYSITRHEDQIVPNTIRKLDNLLTYVHDSIPATAEKQQ